MAPLNETLHATTVSVDGRAVMLFGKSGSGKSAMALQLLALGAALIADDRTIVTQVVGGLTASAPTAIAGQIEARGIGILTVPYEPSAHVVLAVDMEQVSTERMPEPQTMELLGVSLPCLPRVEGPHFAASILLSLRGGLNLGP